MKCKAILNCVKGQKRFFFAAFLLMTAASFIVAGVCREEVGIVFNKAVNICMECIGLG